MSGSQGIVKAWLTSFAGPRSQITHPKLAIVADFYVKEVLSIGDRAAGGMQTWAQMSDRLWGNISASFERWETIRVWSGSHAGEDWFGYQYLNTINFKATNQFFKRIDSAA